MSGHDETRTGERAFEAFARREWPGLVRLAWALTNDRGHAEDVVQIALQRVWRRWAGVHTNPSAYARRAVVTQSISWLRSHSPVEHVTGAEINVPVADRDLDAVVTRDAIKWWLAKLPRRQRAVVVLRYLLDLSVDQTAELLGCSNGTVKSQTSKAMASLRARVATEAGPYRTEAEWTANYKTD